MVKMINSSVDSIYFSYKGSLDPAFELMLEYKKEQALEHKEDQIFEILDYKFLIKSFGWGKYKYRLDGYGFNLFVTPSEKMPCIYIKVNANYLYELGYEKAYREIDDLMSCGILKNKGKGNLSRIDLCVDFQGWRISLEDSKRIVCEAQDDGGYGITKKFQGFTFGKGNVVVRIYNKSVEIKRKYKDWMIEVWKKSDLFDYKKDVWRVEVQLRGKVLKELQIKSVEDSFNKLKGLWNFGLKWCQFKEVSKNRQKSRWKEDKSWKYLRENAPFDGMEEIKRIRQIKREINIKIIERCLFGYLSSLYAALGYDLFEEGLADINNRMNFYYHMKKTSFKEVINKKRKKILV